MIPRACMRIQAQCMNTFWADTDLKLINENIMWQTYIHNSKITMIGVNDKTLPKKKKTEKNLNTKKENQ